MVIFQKNIGDISLNADNNIVFKPFDQTNYLSSSFGLTAFVSPVVKEKTLNKNRSIRKNTVITLDNEEKSGRSYLKYAATS
jgi:hypothetical protein